MATLGRRSNISHDGIKIGIKCDDKPDTNFYKVFDPQSSVTEFALQIAREYEMEKPEEYVLCVENGPNTDQPINYIREQNRELIREGSVLVLVRSPSYIVNETMATLNREKSTVEWNITLKDLHTRHLRCPEFVKKFVEAKGHERLLHLVASGQCSAQVATLCYQAGLHYNLLMAVRVLFMKYGLPGEDPENGLVSWELIDTEVIQKLINGMRYGEVTLMTLTCCYELLENCIRRLPTKATYIISKIDSDLLFARLNNEVDGKRLPDETLQVCLVKFLNAIFRQAKFEQKEMEFVCNLLTTPNRDILRKCIPTLRGEDSPKLDPTILVELQQHLLCPAAMRRFTSLDPADENLMSSLNMMRSMVRSKELSERLFTGKFGPQEIEDFRVLGFENPDAPERDFDINHGGMLAYDCVKFFIENHGQEADELVSPRSIKEGEPFPFIHASTILTNILAKKFRLIGDLDYQDDPVDETDFFPVLFLLDSPFQNVFSKCITAFARTWRDMRATARDMDTVKKVMIEQLTQTFSKAKCRERLQPLDEGLQENNYAEILRRQKQIEEEKRKNKALSDEIRRCLEPRIDGCISHNRIHRMQKGSMFQLIDSTFFNMKGKGAVGNSSLSLRLSPNQKDLYYDKVENTEKIEKRNKETKWRSDEADDKEKISVASITEVTFGKECPHSSKKTIIDQAKNCMTLHINVKDEKDETVKRDINLIAPDDYCLNIWMDGLHALKCHKKDRSSLHKRDFERLMDLEIKVRSLHLPTTHDATSPPHVPPEPTQLPAGLIHG